MDRLRRFVSVAVTGGVAAWLATPPVALAQQVLVPSGASWRYRKGTNEASSPVTLWRTTGFNDSAWTRAAAPFHYGTNAIGGDDGALTGTVLGDMRNGYRCVFLRIPFVVTNVAEIASLRLVANYDDGFVAWINGTEVARANFTPVTPSYTNTAAATHEADPAVTLTPAFSPDSYLVVGTNLLAVQAFNQPISSSDFRFTTTLEITKSDPNPPTLAGVTPAAGSTLGSLTQVTTLFSEPVYGVQAGDLVVNGLPADAVSGASGSTSYTFRFTEPAPGPVHLSWDGGQAILDDSGKRFDSLAPGASWSYTLTDTVAPQVSGVTPLAGATVSALTQVEVTFSEAVQGVDAADLRINGQPAASALGSGAGPYLFKFPQPLAGAVALAWAAGHGILDTAATPNAFAGGSWNVTLNPALATGDVTINEFVAANETGLKDENGEVQDWIELRNRGTNAVNLLGWSLTDDPGAPGKWTFPSHVLPAGGYLVVFASEKDRRAPTGTNRFHTNFKLNSLREYLALFNAESPRVAATEFAPDYPEQRNDYAYGLEATSTWRYYPTPTPGAANGASPIQGVLPEPHFSVPRGAFDAPFDVVLTAPPGATIRYTTDGSEPAGPTGQVYSGPLTIDRTTTLRATASQSGYLPSRTRTHSYFFLDQVLSQPNNPPGFPSDWGANAGFPGGLVPADYEMDLDPVRVDPNDPGSAIDPEKLQRLQAGLRELPLVSVVMHVDDMFGPNGLHPKSTQKTPLLEKPCSVEMILPDGTTAFTTTCGIRMHGNASREPMKNPKHGYKLAFKGDYGEASLRYRMFPDSPAEEFDDLIVRADFGSSWRHWSDVSTEGLGAWQRSRASRTRDAWWKHTLRDMGGIASHSRYCNLFINGLYWGTFDFTEQPTDQFAANYFGGAKENFDIYDQGVLKNGTAAAYNAMLAVTNLSQVAPYAELRRYLDLPVFIDYMLLHFFCGNQDWGLNKNWYAIRPLPGGTFKYVPWDGENLLLNEDINRVPNGGGSTDVPSGLHTKLDDNAEYRLEFADHVHKHLVAPGGALTPAANVARWRKWQAVMDNPIVAESARWGDYRRDVHPYQNGVYQLYTREAHWLTENDRIVNAYLANRNATVLGQLRAAGLYPTVTAPTYNQHGGPVPPGFGLTITAPAGAIYYTLDGTDPRLEITGNVRPTAVEFTGTPVPLQQSAVAKARVRTGATWSALTEASFTVGELGVPLRLTEIMFNPPGGDVYEFVELQNVGAAPLDVGGFSLGGIDFVFPDNTLIPPGALLVLAAAGNPAAFQARYPQVIVAGLFGGTLANGGERLAVVDRAGQTVTAVHYDDENGWPVAADGAGYSLEVIDPRGDPNAPDNWRASPDYFGTPGRPPVAPAIGPIVLNEVLAENQTTITNGGTLPDWVELHNRGSQTVDLTGWGLTDDSNPAKFVFPAGTQLATGAFLVVWCDSATTAPGLHTGFALGRSGETVLLHDAAGHRVDAITFGLQLADWSVGRIGDGWQLTRPTPNAPNVAAPLAAPSEIALNEWLANPGPGRSDWIELFNRAANAPVALGGLYLGTSNALFRMQGLSFVAPRGYVQLFADENPGADHLEFKLPAAGGALVLSSALAQVLDQVVYGVQVTDVSEGRYPDGTTTTTAFSGSVSPGASNYLLAYSGPILHEVLARNNRSAVSPWGEASDWVELFNPGGTAASLAGMALGRSADDPDRWTFPAGATIPAGGHLLVWCAGSRPATLQAAPPYNTGFSLQGDGDAVYLFNPAGQAVDWVNFGFQVEDLSIGRSGGGWALLATPTAGAANAAAAALGPTDTLRVNEWMAFPRSGDDWVELFNPDARPVSLTGLYLTDNPSTVGLTNFQVGPLSFIEGRRWVKWEADSRPSQGPNHLPFSLDDRGETLRLYTPERVLIDAVDFGLQSAGVSQGRLPDGDVNRVDFPTSASPAHANYLPLAAAVIHEVLTHTDPPLEDAVELHNPTATPVSIGGWYLSDSPSDPKRYRIADGTTLPAGGFLVLYQNQFGPADGEADVPPLFSFNSAHGDAVYLFEADAGGTLTGHRAEASFLASSNGVSFGRYRTSVGVDFTTLSQRTFGVDNPGTVELFRTGTGLSNASPRVGPVVIHELMYHPASGVGAPEDPALEFLELHNLTGAAVPLFDPAHPTNVWRLANAVDYAFPPGTTLPALGYLLVVSFDPGTNAAALAAFRGRYGPQGLVVGPYAGRLDNAGESVELLRPDAPQAPPQADAGYVPYFLVDRVAYGALAPWPEAADGGGASLQRITASQYGNDPVNWKAEAATAGAANTPGTGEPPVVVTGPQSQTNRMGQTVRFEVVATGTAPLHYQWWFNSNPLLGMTASNLVLINVQPAQAGDYRVQVTNAFGSILSSPATLAVLVPPAIVTPPSPRSVVAGSNTSFSVVATGTAPLRYQWQRNAGNLPGATGDTLFITGAGAADAGNYRVVITNIAGAVTSSVAPLTVQFPPQITAQPQGGSFTLGSAIPLSVSATGDAPLAYQWRRDGIELPGATASSLTLTNAQSADSGSYTVRVSNPVGAVWSDPAVVAVMALPELLSPQVLPNGHFTAWLSGPAPRTYEVESSTRLGQWSTLFTVVHTQSLTSVTDTGAVGTAERFYRVRLVP